jgi:hypothetical protein
MRIKIIGLALALLFVTSCASNPDQRSEYISQDTRYYESSSFEEIWISAMRSIEELGFMIREAMKEKGLLDAIYESESESDVPPPILNVMIIQELGQIRVNCLALMPGDQGNFQTTLSNVQSFFENLDKHLKN